MVVRVRAMNNTWADAAAMLREQSLLQFAKGAWATSGNCLRGAFILVAFDFALLEFATG
jgi:hypothetical protein